MTDAIEKEKVEQSKLVKAPAEHRVGSTGCDFYECELSQEEKTVENKIRIRSERRTRGATAFRSLQTNAETFPSA